jgi:hypothetical protein
VADRSDTRTALFTRAASALFAPQPQVVSAAKAQLVVLVVSTLFPARPALPARKALKAKRGRKGPRAYRALCRSAAHSSVQHTIVFSAAPVPGDQSVLVATVGRGAHVPLVVLSMEQWPVRSCIAPPRLSALRRRIRLSLRRSSCPYPTRPCHGLRHRGTSTTYCGSSP